MSTAIIEEIQAQHTKLGELITGLLASRPTALQVPGITIELAPGERYAGPILNADGTTSHYVVLLPGDEDDIAWADGNEWAAKAGGILPTRREQALLFANLKDEFQAAYYWSSEEHPTAKDCAFYQYFSGGDQRGSSKSARLRARVVRRLTA